MNLVSFYSPDAISEPIDREEWGALAGQIEAAAIQWGCERPDLDGWMASFSIDALTSVTCKRITSDDHNPERPPGMYMICTTDVTQPGDGKDTLKTVEYGLPFGDDPYVNTEITVVDICDDNQAGGRYTTAEQLRAELEWEGLMDDVFGWCGLGKSEFLDAFQVVIKLHKENSVVVNDSPEEFE